MGNNSILLLPTAKLVPLELQAEFGAIPSAMVPLDGRPALQYIASPHIKKGTRVIIAVHDQADQVKKYLSSNPDFNGVAIDVGVTKSLGETILNVLKQVKPGLEKLIINFADTYVGDELKDNNVICFSEREDLYRWTTFEVNSEKMIVNITDKNQNKLSEEALLVFVGVFVISGCETFIKMLNKTVHEYSDKDLDPFYIAIKDYFNSLGPDNKTFQKVFDWRDFGHIDSYYETKKRFYLNKREFNEMHIDYQRGMLKKTSKNKEKFINEIKWYLKLPRQLQHIAPRVFDYSLEFSNPYLQLEFYGYPLLSDIYLYGDCRADTWAHIFNSIKYAMNEMSEFKVEAENKLSIKRSLEEIYINKTIRRLKPILTDSRFAAFVGNEIVINEKRYFGLQKVIENLEFLFESLGIFNNKNFTIIHGDLCFSNILYDQRNRIIHLIDPRGEFGEYDIYGDPNYDLAKLCHSVEGDYDFILNGLFCSEWKEGKLNYCINIDQRHVIVKDLFRRKILQLHKKEYKKIKFIESLLFLSMIPLHSNKPNSQELFLAKGLEIFTDLIEGKFINM